VSKYDEIAEEYQDATQLDVFRIISHTMSSRLGDVAGRSVLDLACGEGHSTRAIKRLGAGRTVGVDISGEMIRLALEQEAKQPLGIEYITCPAEQLGRIGDFDVVTATFLLNYASTRDELCRMAHTAHQNLRPGCRFLTIINDNCSRVADWPAQLSERYGCRYRALARPVGDGSPLEVTLMHDGREVSFNITCFSRETFEWALHAAGFEAIHWHGLSLPPDLDADGGREHWAPFFELAPLVLIECLA
jgi:SAM-dependent methyltransferase